MEIDPDARAALEPELEPGEKLLWAGRPNPNFLLREEDRGADIFAILFGGGFLIWGALMVLTLSFAHVFFGMWFAFGGAYYSFGRLIHDRLIRRRSVYGVSNGRILVRTNFIKTTWRSFPLGNLIDVTCLERPDRLGTIDFSKNHGSSSRKNPFFYPPNVRGLPIFDRIENARTVFQILDQAISKKKGVNV